MGHIEQIWESDHRTEDDDTVYLPSWMLERLRLAEGEPVCVTLDFDSVPLTTILSAYMFVAVAILHGNLHMSLFYYNTS